MNSKLETFNFLTRKSYVPPKFHVFYLEIENCVSAGSTRVLPGKAEDKVFESYNEGDLSFDLDLDDQSPW